jgi:ketosteroid isomerase-like protein
MSRENVEIVRSGTRALKDGLPALNAFIDEFADPGMEFQAVGRLPDIGTAVRGPEAAKKWYAQLFEGFDFHVEEEELTDAGDAVVAVVRQIARGRGSGIEVANRIAVVFRFREGKMVSVEAYRTKDEAFQAAGLSE